LDLHAGQGRELGWISADWAARFAPQVVRFTNRVDALVVRLGSSGFDLELKKKISNWF
jgi:hypothetical protein